MFKLCARIEKCRGGCICVGHKYGGRSRRGPVNGKEGVDSGELVADFLFFNIEEASDVLNHLFMGKSQFITGRTVWRGRGDEVRGVATLSIGDEEWEGMKMGEEEQDIIGMVGQLCGVWKAKR